MIDAAQLIVGDVQQAVDAAKVDDAPKSAIFLTTPCGAGRLEAL